LHFFFSIFFTFKHYIFFTVIILAWINYIVFFIVIVFFVYFSIVIFVLSIVKLNFFFNSLSFMHLSQSLVFFIHNFVNIIIIEIFIYIVISNSAQMTNIVLFFKFSRDEWVFFFCTLRIS
jgi:hypothetical protein